MTLSLRYLNIRIYNTKHRVTLPLKNRSKGFLWFFSFLVWFSKIQGKKDTNYILLLDEPGLSLHASAQNDLLRFIEEKLAPEYQVLYTTHSPFKSTKDTVSFKLLCDFLQHARRHRIHRAESWLLAVSCACAQ